MLSHYLNFFEFEHLVQTSEELSSVADTNCVIDLQKGHMQTPVCNRSRPAPAKDDSPLNLPEEMRALLTENNTATRAHPCYPTDERLWNVTYAHWFTKCTSHISKAGGQIITWIKRSVCTKILKKKYKPTNEKPCFNQQ